MISNNKIKEFANEITNQHKMVKPSDNIERKFIETYSISDFEIFTDDGWKDIKNIGMTIPYEIWEIETKRGHKLKCADTHIVFDSEYDEIFVKDLNKDTRLDKIITIDGPDTVIKVINTKELDTMFDIEVDSDEHRYWTNDILSHNSIWLANDAVNFVKCGYDVAFISAEMADRKVVRRIGSNMLNIPMSEYDKKSRDQTLITRKLQQIQGGMIPPGRLFIKEYPTSQATVLDIEAYLRDLEETQGIKLKIIVIDYINILANYRNPNSENTYLTIKHIAQDLRAMAKRNNWLIITATQINRGGYDATDISMKDIAESAGLSHTADMIYGIIQDTTMHLNEEYWIKVLKIRDGHGKNSKCKYTIDYNYMRLYETEEVISGNISS